MQEPMTSEKTRVRAMLDEAAARRTADPEGARALVLDARVVARAAGLHDDEAEALYQLASLAHRESRPWPCCATRTVSGAPSRTCRSC